MTSDVTITGNLTVQGSSTYLTVASTNTYVNDPLIVLNNAFTGTNTYDIGLLINRGNQTTTALIWKEANKQFELTYTSDTGTSYGAINNSGYANLKVGNLTVAGITTLADIGAGNLTLSGDLAVNGGDITTTAATATVFNANATTVSAFGAATTLGIGAGTGTLTLNNATVTTPGQIISTRAGSATTGNGQIFLNGSTSNRIDWAAAGTGAPTFTTRTGGTKVVLYPALSGSTVDYAIGVDSATMWSSVPENGSSFNFKWYGAETLVANLSGTGNFTTVGDVAVNGGDITTTAGTFNLVDANATTVNFAGAATAIDLGATTGTLTINNPTVVGTQTTQALYNTTATTLNFAGAATTLIVGAATGVANIRNATTNIIGNATVGGTLAVTGDATLTGDLAVNGGDITTTSATATVFNTNATTVDAFKAATDLEFGATSGTITINNPTLVGTQTTQAVYNTTATTVNAFGAATTLIVGATTGIANIRNATTNILGNATVGGTLAVTGDTTLTADLAVNGGDLTTSAGTFNLIDATATTVNAFGAATTIELGATSGTLTINNPTVVGSQSTQALYNTTATTMNFAGAATTLIVGSATGVANIRNATTNILGNATVGGTLGVTGDATLTADLAVNGGDLTTSAGTFNLVNANATTVNFAGGATTLAVGATSGTLTINNPTVVGSQTTQAVFNTTATTLNFAGAATTLIVGATTGVANIRNATTNIIGNATVGGATTITGDLAVNGGDLTSTATTFNLLDSTTLNINAFGAATDINMGVNNAAARFGIKTPNIWFDNLANLETYSSSIKVFNTSATTVNAFGAATTLIVGATTGVANIRNATTNVIGNATVGGTLGVTGNVTITGTLGVTAAVTLTDDLAVNGGDLTTTAGTFNLLNANAITVDAFKAATDLEFGATSGTLTINNPTVVGTQTTQNVYNTVATTVNAFGAASTMILGATTGVANIRNATTNIIGNATVGGTLGLTGDVTLAGDLAVNGGDITTTASTFNLVNANATTVDAFKAATDLEFGATSGTLTINNPTVVGSQTTQNLYNTTATTLNIGGAATALNLGASTGNTTVQNNLITTGNIKLDATTQSTNTTSGALIVAGGVGIAKNLNVGGNVVVTGDLTVNGNVTTLNTATLDVEDLNITVAKGAADSAAANGAGLTVDGAGATILYTHATTSWNLNKHLIGTSAQFSTTLGVTGDTTLTADLAVNGGDLTTSAGTFNLVNANATTLNLGGAATTIAVGATSGTITIGNPTLVGTQTTQAVYNTVATTVNAFGAASTLIVGATTGVANIRNATTNILGNATVGGTLAITGDTTLTGDLAVNGGDLTTSAGTFNLVNANATTLNLGGAATTIAVGANSGTITIGNPTLVGTQTTQAVYNTTATTVNAFGAATTLIVGATTGVANLRNATTNILGNATVGGTLAITGDTTLTGDLAVNGGDITTTSATATVFNTNATTVNAFGAATTANIGASTGTTTVKNNLTVGASGKLLTVNGSMIVEGGAYGNVTTTQYGAVYARAYGSNAYSIVQVKTNDNTTGMGMQAFTGSNGLIYSNSGIEFKVNATVRDNDVPTGGTVYVTISNTGIVTLGNDIVSSTTTQNVFNTVATTVNAFGAATTLTVGATTGVANIRNATTNIIGNATVGGTLGVTGNATVTGILNVTGAVTLTDDLAVNGGDITTTASTFNLLNANATTVDAFKATTDLEFGATSGTLTINNPTVVGSQTTQAVFNTTATTVNAFGAATTMILGATTGTANIRNATTNILGNTSILAETDSTSTDTGALIVAGGVGIAKTVHVGGNVYVNSGKRLAVGADLVSNVIYPENAAQFTTSSNAYSRIAIQNLSSGASATSEFIAIANNGTNAASYLVTGITSSGFNEGIIIKANDGYTLTNGGNLVLSSTSDIKLSAGGLSDSNMLVTINAVTANVSILANNDSNSTTTGALTVAGGVGIAKKLRVAGDTILTGDLAVNGGVVTTTATAFNLIEANATTVSAFGAATALNFGANTGTATLRNPTVVGTEATQTLYNTTATTMNFAGAATTLIVGATTGVANIRNATTNVIGNATVGGTLAVTGNTTLTGDLAVNGGDLTTTATTFNLLDATATTVNALGAATTIDLGATSGTLTINNPTVVGSQSTQDLYNTTATTLNFAGAATTLIVGASTGVANIRNATTNVIGNATVGGTLDVSAGATINSTQTSGNFVVKGAVATSLIVANSTYGAVVIGGSNATPTLGSVVKFNSTDSIQVPVGSTADRPGNSGNVDVTGMMRYSTTLSALEFYNGTAWIPAGSDSTFTIITSDQFTGDGVQDTYTLSANTTTNGTMVSINGVVQIPTFSYSITVDQLLFTEIPAVGDLIDVRILTTTQTTGSEISSSNGLNSFMVTDADGAQLYSGTSAKTLRVTAAPDGTWAYKNGTKTTYNQTVTNIASAATPVIVDSFATASYTTAKYIVQTKNGSSVESMEAVLVQDGANAYVSIFGIVSSGSGLGTLSANIVSGNVKLYYTSTSVTNSNVKVYTTYIV